MFEAETIHITSTYMEKNGKQWRVSDITKTNNSVNLPPAHSPTDSSLSSCRSSVDQEDASEHLTLHPSPPLQLHTSPPPRTATTFSAAPNRSVPADPVSVMKPQSGGGVSIRSQGSWVSELAVKKAALVFRFFGFVFCLVSFSVMASDRNKGWATDSFNRYIEFR